MDMDQFDINPTLLCTNLIISRKYSTKGIPRLSPNERALITIPDNVKDILVGILLGDAPRGVVVIIRLLFLSVVYYLFYIEIFLLNTDLLLYSMYSLPLIYMDPKLEKNSILTDNKGKYGIYM
jgi:hypothetical protein